MLMQTGDLEKKLYADFERLMDGTTKAIEESINGSLVKQMREVENKV